MKRYLLRHLQILLYSLGQMHRSPLPTIFTVLVLGIALALPASLYTLMENLTDVVSSWQGRPQVTVYLQVNTPESEVNKLKENLQKDPRIQAVTHKTPEQALTEFKQHSGLGDAMSMLEENPLPPVLIATPKANETEAVKHLMEELENFDGVEQVQLDMEWLQRLNRILQLGRRAALILAVMLALGVVLIISNTIRLAIVNRSQEIEIMNQIGGTNSFIRRPFLYYGLLQGVLAAILAWIIVGLVTWLLSGPTDRLAELYHTEFDLRALSFKPFLLMLASAGFLGWAASWFTVNRYLRSFYPKAIKQANKRN